MKNIQEQIKIKQKNCIQQLETITTLSVLEDAYITFLGRKGTIAQLMPLLKNATVEEKRIFGPLLNSLNKILKNFYQKNVRIF